ADSVFAFKIDSSFQTTCGYLIVPENRTKASSRMIKLPFIILKSKNPDKKKDPFLFSTGGPGGSSLGWINGMQKSSVIETRDCIAFEQRGTHFAIPNLRSFELDTAIRISYRKNLNKDSMWVEGVKRYKKKLEKKGIDLSGYNTDESAADIVDFLKALKIDSVNLCAGSYSGDLMLNVLRKDPSRIRSLVFDSPLPNFTHSFENEPANFAEALNVLFKHCDKDSSDRERYGNIRNRFEQYFTSAADKKFYFPYVEKGTTDTMKVEYTTKELLDHLDFAMQSPALKDVPSMIVDMISGNHAPYIKKKLDDVFNKNIAPNGMRMSVYCAGEANYSSQRVVHQLLDLYPYMKNFHDDVFKAVCDCWMVPPVPATAKEPFYSDKPILIGDGEMDPACSPLYMMNIKHFMPNAQCFLFINRSHGIGGLEFRRMTQTFLDNPYAEVKSPNEKVRLIDYRTSL
ncbi:MAG: alpha/beta fold hydrolase, partial [Bacteroidetes bacterium]|nr:alpha/beta fold hydrolase [Bacteroidota bacterium]